MTRLAGAATATLDPAESGAPAGARRYDRPSEAPRREGTEPLRGRRDPLSEPGHWARERS